MVEKERRKKGGSGEQRGRKAREGGEETVYCLGELKILATALPLHSSS